MRYHLKPFRMAANQSLQTIKVGDRKNKRKAGPGKGCKRNLIRHETLETSPEGTVHHLENKI